MHLHRRIKGGYGIAYKSRCKRFDSQQASQQPGESGELSDAQPRCEDGLAIGLTHSHIPQEHRPSRAPQSAGLAAHPGNWNDMSHFAKGTAASTPVSSLVPPANLQTRSRPSSINEHVSA